jgi:nucleotide-binding universal stress UspA family protein
LSRDEGSVDDWEEPAMNDPAATRSTILVPLDGSGLAEHALGPAAAIAEHTASRLRLLSVPMLQGLELAWYSEGPYYGPELELVSELAAQAREDTTAYLDAKVEDLAKRGIGADAVLRDDEPAAAILAAAEEVDAWLVALATHGRSGLGRWALGSVATKVIQGSRRPLLIVRAGVERLGPGIARILVALDGSEAAEAVLPEAKRIAAAFGAQLDLTSVDVVPAGIEMAGPLLEARGRYREQMESYLRDLAERLRGEGLSATWEIVDGEDAAGTLVRLADDRDADLIAMTTHGRGGLARWALGSVADRIVLTAETPVLLERIGPEEM